MWEWIIYPLMFFTGFVDSIAGGGGLISIPSLLAVGVPAHTALGTNKFTVFMGTGLSAAYFIKKGHVKWKSVVTPIVGALAGSATGAQLVLTIDERNLKWFMVIFIPVVGAFILTRSNIGEVERDLPPLRMAVTGFVIGFLIGTYDGFIGPGTGTFFIIAFTSILGLGLLNACGNTKVVNFASNIAAVSTFIYTGAVDYRLGIPCAGCAMLGYYIGSRLAIKKGIKVIRPMMLFVVALLLLKICTDLVRDA